MYLIFSATFDLSSANAFNLDQSRNLLFRNELINGGDTLKVALQILGRIFYKNVKQEGHDGPLSLHWLILGNFFKTYDPEEGLKLVAMSSNKKISKYFTK